MRASLLGILITVLLALPVPALAQTPTDDVYDPLDARAHSSTQENSQQASSSGLAFTGLDVGLVVLAGAAILGTGLALRRATRAD